MEGDNPMLPSSLDWKISKWKRSMDNVLEDKVQTIGDILNDLNVGGPSSIGSSREYFPDSRSNEWASSKITNPTSSISSQKFLESGKHSYHRGTAVRMLKFYLADLVKFNISIDDSFQQVEENQAFLKELDEANQREPNSSLTSSERRKFSLILEDYQTALTTVLEDQRHEEIMPVDVDSVEFQDVAEGIPQHLYEAIFSGDGYVESIINALDLCETQVREFKKLLLVVRVFRHQCTKLVETLEPTAVNVFGWCHKVMGGLQKLEAGGSGNRSKSYVRFCFESLVRLARNFQSVVDLLKKCASENLPKTTLEVADLPSPDSLMSRRWSKFSLAVRNCEWGMDLVEFSFYTLETLLAGGTHIPDDISFKWCEEECRTVLQSVGRLGKEGMKLEKSVDHELEAQDLGDLIDQLRHLAEASEPVEYADLADSVLGSAGSEDSVDSAHSADSAELGGLADPSDFIMQQMLKVDAARGQLLSKVVFNRAKMANFLSEKLSGPIPHAEDLPWTFRVNPSTLKFREFLDSGGSGMVAEYMWLGESVAVKTVRSPGLTWQKFEEEAAVLAVVQHPNVVRLIGCGFIDERNTGMLVMELMDHDLRTVIESKMKELGPESSPFIASVAIEIILQIAEAMRHLRDHRVLHRDLKTKNILVNIYKPLNPSGVLCSDLPHLQEEYVVKIIDFGLARCRPGSSWLHTRMEGTSRWMAPEVFHSQELDGTHEYQWSADVYSFAMTCYEILTGKLPFATYPDDAIPERAILAGMRPEGLDEAEVPDLLKTLVKQCWATDPGERPSFEEIVKSLWGCRLEAILPVLEQPVTSKPPVVFKDAILPQTGRPNLIGDKVLIDLTKDLLGVSSTGYVIRTNCSGMQGRTQPCALKRIDVMDSNGSDLARLSHPHVVQFIGHWIEEKSLFLIMELMDGDLAKLMANTKKPRASPFTLHVTVDLMLQIALGMRHLHEMGVSHPHLKCENVLYRAVIKTEAYQVGDVLVKLGGFGWSRPADVPSKNRDVVCFGQTCLEILTGNVNPETVSKSSIPETVPVVLKNCIVSCLDTHTTFSNVVKELLRAKSYIVQCCKDETICSSEMIQTQSVPAKTDGSLDEIFTVHQLHPQSGDVSTSIRATLVFFHGFHKVPEEWRRTWMTRDNKLVWPQKWLPEDLSSLSIRVLSVSFDANSNVSNKYNRYEIGKNLVEGLILSPRWKLGDIGEAIFLIGHSFGGVLIKSFITEAQDFVTKRPQYNTKERVKCMKFLNRLAKVVFYSVPHAALAAVEFEHYISECRKVVPLQRSSFLRSLREDTRFVADMCQLSVDFESALPENVNVLAFLEGKPMGMVNHVLLGDFCTLNRLQSVVHSFLRSLSIAAVRGEKRVLVTEKSFEGLSRPWEWHKIEKDNHFEVSRPESKNHIGYKFLLDHLLQYMTSNAFNVKGPSLRVIVFAVVAARRLQERAKTSGVKGPSLRVIVFAVVAARRLKERAKTSGVKRPSLRVIVFALVAIRKLKDRVRVSEIGRNNLNAREPAKLSLGYYHRGTAIRMLTDYLSDLTTLKLPLDNNLQKCVDENRALLKEMSEAYQREPNSPLTLQERSKLVEMLKDYEAALSAVSEVQDDKEEVADVDNREPVYLYDAKFSGTEYVKSLTSALGLCETQVREFKKLLPVVRVFHQQCKNLVESLEPSATNIFEVCHKGLGALERLKLDRVQSGRLRNSVHFCFEFLVGLAQKFECVLDLLRKCASENLPRTALELAYLPPTPLPKRWSEFSLAFRNCEWSMDLVKFGFYTLEKVLAGGTHIFQGVSFRWSEEKCRLVLQTEGRLGREDSRLGKSGFDRSYELAKEDMDHLVVQLRHLGESASSGRKWKLSHLLSSKSYGKAHVAHFLSEKLSRPIPHAQCAPPTFSVDPSSLKFRQYLGIGSSGMVAKYSWFGETVAVKSIRSSNLNRHCFENEATVLATVQHPNVVRLIAWNFIEDNRTGQLVMELMDDNLRSIIESKMEELRPGSTPFTTNVAIDIILQIAEGMRHLRDHRVLHRDLKAMNVLVKVLKPLSSGVQSNTSLMHRPFSSTLLAPMEESYVVKLADFGLAKHCPHSSWVNTLMAGTSRWRAPEVFHVRDTEVMQEYKWPADVYSFAMTCYEVLTGKLPFAYLQTPRIHEHVMAGMRPEGLDQLDIPELLKELVKKCWATDPKERPSFDEIVKSLWECRLRAIVPGLEL